MNYPTVHKETTAGGRVKIAIEYDPEPTSPREWDNPTVMVCDYRGHNLGDRKPDDTEREAIRRGGWRLLERYLRARDGATHVYPLTVYEHGGITMSLGDVTHGFDGARWDTSLVGFIYDPKVERDKCMGEDYGELRREAFEADVQSYDDYLQGNVYGYTVKLAGGEVLDSCWGFMPDHEQGKEDYAECLAEARSIARHYAEKYEGC